MAHNGEEVPQGQYDEQIAVEEDGSEVETPLSNAMTPGGPTGGMLHGGTGAAGGPPGGLAPIQQSPPRGEAGGGGQEARGPPPGRGGLQDRAYDEAIPVETDDSEVETPGSSEAGSPVAANAKPPTKLGAMNQRSPGARSGEEGSSSGSGEDGSSSGEGSSTSDSEDGGEGKAKAAMLSGAYNPDDFKNLKVSSEVEEVFGYITRYKPHTIELDTALKPFVPEFVPSIGEVDAFLKMPRPDGQNGDLGTVCLDEPALNPSDPSILDLKLISLSKNQDLQPMEVRSIENAEKCPKEIENWVKRIEELNRGKPAATVMYTRRMPDIEQLMQVWMAEFEEYLQQNPLPDMADLDLDLKDYIKVIASILDVPVYGQLTETLHVIFTLYSEFKTNQHFSKTETLGGNADQYNFSQVGHFNQGQGLGATGVPPAAGGAAPVFGAPGESMAPSRAPSPVHGGGQNPAGFKR